MADFVWESGGEVYNPALLGAVLASAIWDSWQVLGGGRGGDAGDYESEGEECGCCWDFIGDFGRGTCACYLEVGWELCRQGSLVLGG